ncbi:hypothetical protein [Bacillus sp. FJAT-29937]|uniref:hypothetical protein n=1 Tax=Bacillus sp. FJAT-29937 TaxID=1720553 RepID=UPI00082C14CF|nr:hypothetical protein [Bacillus sp. FJAT-29937]
MAVNIMLENGIRLFQLLFVPLFGLIFLIALFFFLFAFKNPFKRRKAYLFSIGGSVGMLLALYMPLIITYYMGTYKPKENSDATIRDVVDITLPWGEVVYEVIKVLFEPMIYAGFFIGMGVWLLAAKNPARKRIGMGMVFGAPLIWTFLQISPDIYYFFVPR